MAKEKQTKRVIAMALAAAVTVTAVPVDAYAASSYSAKVARAQKKAETRKNKYKVEINEDLHNIVVQVPETDVDDPATEDVENQNSETFGDPEGTEKVNGNTTVTTEQQGKVTITTTEITSTENGSGTDAESNMDHVSSEVAPDGKNDLIAETPSVATPEGTEEIVNGATNDAYEYVYVGTGNTSQLRPSLVYTEPMTDEEKLEKWGDYAYIKSSYSEMWVNYLPDPSIAQRDENGNLVKDAEGYVLDKDGNRILKAEHRVVGPDGKTYYMQRIDNLGEAHFVEGWYVDGEWIAELNKPADTDEGGNPVLKTVQLVDQNGDPVLDENNEPIYVEVGKIYKWQNATVDGKYICGPYGGLVKDKDGNVMVNYAAVYATAQQFVLVNKETGEVVTTYCADVDTKAKDGFQYNVENLEDADYYDDDQAAKIRTIASKGYWGTEEGRGSLQAMKDMLAESGEFTEAELASLTDGVALTATQMAIWSCSNHMAGAEFVNTGYFGQPGKVAIDGSGVGGDVPEEKEDEAKLLMKLYTYMKNLDGTSYEGEETTANTIINKDNFAENLSVTVLEKTEGHENNADDDDTNDAYTTNVSFALVVTPSTANGDDLVVKVLDANGNELASGRIAGVNKEGERQYDYIEAKDGNYTFKNIVMTEGEQNFNITMEGIQNLKEGVYLYSSEVTTEGESSQTMVGIAQGDRKVDVSLNLKFDLDVNDQIVVRERRGGGGGGKTPPSPTTDIPEPPVPMTDIPEPPVPTTDVPGESVDIVDEDVPLADIPDEEVPLAPGDEVVAETGDSNHMTAGFGGMLAALAGMFMLRKKKEQ